MHAIDDHPADANYVEITSFCPVRHGIPLPLRRALWAPERQFASGGSERLEEIGHLDLKRGRELLERRHRSGALAQLDL